MAGHVFISYSRVDRPYIDELASYLISFGVPVWYDHEVEVGDDFADEIEVAIDECAALVVVLTPGVDCSEVGTAGDRTGDEAQQADLPAAA